MTRERYLEALEKAKKLPEGSLAVDAFLIVGEMGFTCKNKYMTHKVAEEILGATL